MCSRARCAREPLKVLRVIGSANPATGGPIEGLLRTSEIMAGMGCTNEVMCLDRPNDPWIAHFPLPVHAFGPGYGKYRYTPTFAPWLRTHARDYDAAILHGIWNYSSVGAWRALAGSQTPYAVFTHGMLDPWFRKAYPLKHAAKQVFWIAAEGRVLADARAVLFTTTQERDLARNAFLGYRYRERVVAYGTADAPEDNRRQAEAFRAAVPQLGDKRYILFLSRVHPKKGCDILLDGFRAIAERDPALHLVIAGPDMTGWRPELEARAARLGISDRVHWPGFLAGEAKWGALRGAEAFVLPSHQENFGIAVAEALACGTPVLISRRVNIADEVEESGCGLVAEDNVEGVIELLSRFLALDEAARQRMRQAARAAFLDRFDVRKTARDLVGVVEEMRNGSARPN